MTKPGRPKNPAYTSEQIDAFCAEIEDWMFCEGLHVETVRRQLIGKYKISPRTADEWIARVKKRWRDAQAGEDLTDRQFQLERMGHYLYQTSLDGVPMEVRKRLQQIVKLLDKGEVEKARQVAADLSRMKIRNLSVAQRVLWNLSLMAGVGQRLTIDLSGAGASLTPATKAAIAAAGTIAGSDGNKDPG